MAVAIAAALASPAALRAEPLLQAPLYSLDIDTSRWETNYFEAGVGYGGVDGDGYAFGQYNGLTKSQAFAVVNGHVAERAADGRYHRFWGTNLGLDSRQLGASYGMQGDWGVAAQFEQIPNYATDSGSFIFTGLGSPSLGLPAGFSGITAGNSQPPANADAVVPFARSGFGVELDRDFFTLTGNKVLAPGWELTGKYNYQSRDGTKLTGAVLGTGGGNARAVIVPYAVDDTTQQFELAVRYADKQMQFGLGYWYSRFSNNYDSLTWQNPYGFVNGWQAASGVGFPTGYGRSSLDPDNDYQQFKVDFAYQFTQTTRVVTTLQYGMARQDQAFLPYTINVAPLVQPGLSVPVALPRSSLDGKLDTTLLDITFTSRPIDKVFVKIAYTYDDRDNETASSQYLFAQGDVLNQPVIPPNQTPDQVNANQIRTNLPIGTTVNKFVIDGDYRLSRKNTLRGWYQYRRTDYEVASQQSRADSDTNQLGVELKSRANQLVNGTASYIWDRRRGAEYSTNATFSSMVTPTTQAAINFFQLPTIRYFTNADYTQNQLKALVSITPSSPLALQLQANWWQRDYEGPDCGGPNDQLLLANTPPLVMPAQCHGLQEATGQNYTIDGQYRLHEGLSLTAFFTWSQLDQSQTGRSFAAVATNPAFAVDVDRNWTVSPKTTDSTVGLGANWKPDGRPFDLGFQYLYNQGTTEIGISAGPALAQPSALPDVKSRLNSFQLYGRWQYSKSLLVRANYWYQRLVTDNWSYDDTSPVSSNGVLLTGQSSAEYRANVFGVSLTYSWW